MRIVDTEFLKSLAGPVGEPVIVRKDGQSTAEPIGDRLVRFTISSSDVDRDNDVVDVKGWQTSNYIKNSVVLWGHDQSQLPIGKTVSLEVNGNALMATVEFVGADVPLVGERAEAVYQLVKQGYLSATSVGFIPLAYDLSDRKSISGKPGLDIHSAELVELSIVNVPSNPSALVAPMRHDASEVTHEKSLVAKNIKLRRAHRAFALLLG